MERCFLKKMSRLVFAIVKKPNDNFQVKSKLKGNLLGTANGKPSKLIGMFQD